MAISLKPKRKVLVLHGYAQNAYMISRRITRLMKDCDDDLEFYYLDGPLIIRPAQFNSPKLEDFPPASTEPCQDELACGLTRHPPPSSTPRGWWIIDHNIIKSPTRGLETSLTLLKTVFRENRFEAIIGFSQGSAMAEYITSMLEGHYPHPAFCDNSRLVHPPLKYAILNSGFLLRGPYMDWTKETPQDFDFDYEEMPILDTPILHMIGKNDVVVVPERTGLLLKFSRNKKVLEHAGGHFINTQPRWRSFYADFFRDPLSHFVPPVLENRYSDLRAVKTSSGLVSMSNADSNIMTAAGRLSTISERDSTAGSSTPDSGSAPQTPRTEDAGLPEYPDSDTLPAKFRKDINSIVYFDM